MKEPTVKIEEKSEKQPEEKPITNEKKKKIV